MSLTTQVDQAHQQQMRRAFFEQLHQRWQPAPDPHTPYPMIVGLETEYLLIDAAGNLICEATRNQILNALPNSTAELGAGSIETHTAPVPIAGSPHSLRHEAERVERETVRVARQFGARLVRIGTYPGAFADLRVTQEPARYQNLLDVSHAMHRIEGVLPLVQIGKVTLPELRCEAMCGCQSTHLNIQVPNLPRTIHMLNKAFELVPYLTALTAHSALLDATPTGYKEVRSMIWEPLFTFPHFDASHGVDTRRVGFPQSYYADWDSYWRDVADKFFNEIEPANAFASNMKNFWRTVRMKPCPGAPAYSLLEIRAFSPQPTLAEDMALAVLVTGLLHDPVWLERPLLPMELAQQNLYAASMDGLYATLAWQTASGTPEYRPATELAAWLLQQGEAYWCERAPYEASLFDLLRHRMHNEPASPARKSQHLYDQQVAAGSSRNAAAQHVLQAYVVRYEDA